MMVQQSVQQQPGRKQHAWKHSTWITAAWEWFLELVGRAAEAILVISVLYASVKLLPVVHMPAGLDVVVFVAQFVALDVGGLSLGKLAKQAQEAGNEAGALYAGRMSKALIVVMIAGVVVVALEELFPIPANWKLGIDTVLLIARSILAVLYGHVIHSVKVDDQAQSSTPPALDIQQMIATAVADLQTTFDQRLAEISDQVKQMTPAPVVDYQAITGSVLTALESRFASEMKRMQNEITQQVSFALERKAQQHFSNSSQTEMELESHRKQSNRQIETLQNEQKRAGNILPFHQETQITHQETEGRKAMVIRLYHEDTSRSDSDIALLSGVPNTTVWRYLKPYRDHAKTGEIPAISKDETA